MTSLYWIRVQGFLYTKQFCGNIHIYNKYDLYLIQQILSVKDKCCHLDLWNEYIYIVYNTFFMYTAHFMAYNSYLLYHTWYVRHWHTIKLQSHWFQVRWFPTWNYCGVHYNFWSMNFTPNTHNRHLTDCPLHANYGVPFVSSKYDP